MAEWPTLRDDITRFVRGPEFDPPPLPRIAEEVWNACSLGDASALQVANIVHRDPLVAARVMRLANSSLLAGAVPANTLREAVVRIGFRELLNLVLMVSLRGSLFVIPSFRALGESCRRHCVATALAAGEIARETQLLAPARAFLLGLLHDIGQPVVLAALERLRPGVTMADVELSELEQLVHEFHGEVGLAVARKWRLDDQTTHLIQHHHTPVTAAGGPIAPSVAVTLAADWIAGRIGFGLEPDDIHASGPPSVGLPADLLERVAADLPARLQQYDEPL